MLSSYDHTTMLPFFLSQSATNNAKRQVSKAKHILARRLEKCRAAFILMRLSFVSVYFVRMNYDHETLKNIANKLLDKKRACQPSTANICIFCN